MCCSPLRADEHVSSYLDLFLFPFLNINICCAPVLQQQEVFDACFNSLHESEIQVLFLQYSEMETHSFLCKKRS